MPIPPDDVPRSPTGRVPQWVRDEAEGRAVASTEWRTGPAAQDRVGRSRRRRSAARRSRALGGRRRLRAVPDTSWRSQRPSRRERAQPFLVAFVVLVFVGGGVLQLNERYPERFADLRAMVDGSRPAGPVGAIGPGGGRIPADAHWPSAGLEESAERLLPAPEVVVPSSQFQFSQLQPAADGLEVPVTWSPCRPIHYVVNAAGTPQRFTDDVVRVVAEVSAATGLSFVSDGLTGEPPASPREPYQEELYGPRWAPVLIAVSDAATTPELGGSVAGLGGFDLAGDPATGVLHAVSGVVLVDRDVLSAPDERGVPRYVAVLRHELGHLVGLGHVEDPTQIMNPQSGAVLEYQGGDLTGLAQVGAGPCAPGV